MWGTSDAGGDARSDVLFSYVNCERRVPQDHPLRAILRIVDAALAALSPEFEGLYAKFGRPSIPPSGCSALCCCRRSIRSVPRRS
jgi:hypothetical protein